MRYFEKHNDLWLPRKLRDQRGMLPGLLPAWNVAAPAIPMANMEYWFDADQETAYADTDRITTATDQSGNGNDFTNGGGNTAPRYRTTAVTINGLPVAYFGQDNETSNRFDRIHALFDSSGWGAATIFFVARNDFDPPATSLGAGLWHLNDGFNFTTHHPFTDGIVYSSTYSTVRKTVGNLTPSLASPYYAMMRSTAGSWIERVNGTQVFSTGTNTFNGMAADINRIGNDPTLGDYQFQGVIGEIIIYSAALNDTDRDAVEAYLAAKWGI